MSMTLRAVGAFCSMLAVAILPVGCQHYSLGSVAHPELQSIAVGEIRNLTDEPSLDTFLRVKLPAELMSEGSLELTTMDRAQTVVLAKVESYTVSSKGSTRIEDGADSERIYRTTIYGISVRVSYQVIIPGREKPVIGRRMVTGKASISDELDLAESRQKAFEVAIDDAARKIARDIAEAW